jgi:hypothetical protein
MDEFSKRHGYSRDDAEITIREDAPSELRSVVVDLAEGSGLRFGDLREVVCRALLRRQDPGNWSASNQAQETRSHLDDCEWFAVYDVIEAIYAELKRASERYTELYFPQQFEERLNSYFRREGIGWQLVDGRVQVRGPEAFEEAVSSARDALRNAARTTAASEIHEALRDLSRRPKPDVTGSIQHAIAALECVARDVSGDAKATLGEIVKRNPGLFPPPLDEAVTKLWGFASERGRHLRQDRLPSYEEAELLVHVSAAVSGYIGRKVS